MPPRRRSRARRCGASWRRDLTREACPGPTFPPAVRHNHPMTRLCALGPPAAAACGGPAAKSTLPTVDTKPGDDLARAQVNAVPGDGSADDPRLGTAGGDAGRTFDLDTIRIGVVGTDAAGD